MTTKQIAGMLERNERYVKKYKGQFKYFVSYFYRHGNSPDKLVSFVKSKIPQAVITDSGDHFHTFVGGAKAGSAQDSYLWVTFTIPENTEETFSVEDVLAIGDGFQLH